MKQSTLLSYLIILILLGGCSLGRHPVSTQSNLILSPTLTSVQVPTQPLRTQTPESTPTLALRTLVICLGAEPDTLYPYGGQILATQSVMEAVYDGPIDQLSSGYHPVILEKLPSLENGDAQIQPVIVHQGDLIVDDSGEPGSLSAGEVIRPAGCQSPDCAISYTGGEVEMDQMVVTFTMLENLKWSDGISLTAYDSAYSYRLDVDPNTPSYKYLVRRTASYEAIDERTTRWVGLPGFLDQTYFLNFWTPYPEHVWGQYTASELVNAEVSAEKPLGWGPYRIDEWEKGAYIRMSRNPNYFRAAQGLPRFDQLIFRFEGYDPLSLLLSGKCDILDQEASGNLIESATITTLQAEQKLKVYFATSRAMETLDFSLQPAETWRGFSSTGAFHDVRLRQAIAMCLNRQRVVDEVFLGRSLVPDSYIPPSYPLYNPNLPTYEFDVGAGSALLDEIGWVDDDRDPTTPRIYQGEDERIPAGTKLAFYYQTASSALLTRVTHILAESLAQCGIEADVQQVGAETFFYRGPDGPLFGRSFDIADHLFFSGETPPCDWWLTESIPGDPTLTDTNSNLIFPLGWSGTNFSGFSDPEFDHNCHASLSLLPGQAGYFESNLEAQEIFARELPSIPLFMDVKLAVTRPDLCGLIMDPLLNSEMWKIEEFDYGPACQGN